MSVRGVKLLVLAAIFGMSTFAATADTNGSRHKEYHYRVCFTDKGRYTFDTKNCDPGRVGSIIGPRLGERGEGPRRPSTNVNEGPASTASAIATATPSTVPSKASKACPEGLFSHLVIGDLFTDLNFIDTANCNAAAAKGAQFSWARDGVVGNSQWAAKGAAAWESIWLNEPTSRPQGPYVNLLAVAPVVDFQRVENTNPKIGAKQNIDVLSYGFSSEALIAGVQDAFLDTWQVYLRARATINGDWEGHTNSWSATFEFEPLSDLQALGGVFHLGSNILIGDVAYLWIYPLLRAQYFEALHHSTDPMFNRGDVFRAGPAVSVSLVPQPIGSYDPSKPRPAPQWILNLTYSWYTDFLHGQQFQHWNPSFTYNITDNIGFSAGYERGKIETNGKSIDLATVSLTIKN